MPPLRAIETFVKALEGGSIAAAARQLGISAAAASQNIARLERELGTRLLTRTTRSMALTEAGERYLARVAPVLEALERAQSDVVSLQGELQGRLRIACMSAFGRHVLAPLLPAFAARHPRLALELLVVDRPVDVLKEDVDISVRYRAMLEPGMAVRPLVSVHGMLCASPAYLQAHGCPQTAQDLLAHACLLYRREMDGRFMRWPLYRGGQRVDVALPVGAVSSDIDALAEMAVAGGGIAWLGSLVAFHHVQAGRLVPLQLQPPQPSEEATALQWEDSQQEFFACFRDRQSVPAKVRALVDYLVEVVPQLPVLQWPIPQLRAQAEGKLPPVQ